MTIRFFRLPCPPDGAGPVFMANIQLLLAMSPMAHQPHSLRPSGQIPFIDLGKSARIQCTPALFDCGHYGRVVTILSISSDGF